MGASACSSPCSTDHKDVVPVQSRNSCTVKEDAIKSWGFSSLELDHGRQDQVSTWLLMTHRGQCFENERNTIQNFVHQAHQGYLPNPYHNFSHAVDVMHGMFMYGTLIGWGWIFPSIIQFSMLVAALCHDISHPGFSNAFLIDVCDELARMYNDISPLENMHCSKLFDIIKIDECNVFGHLRQDDFRELRKLIIDAILHTDMAYHNIMVSDLGRLYAENAELFAVRGNGELTREQADVLGASAENRTLVLRVLLHGSDVLNPARPWPVAYKWAHHLAAEFFAQGDKERELGLPVAKLNDRFLSNIPDSQIGFVQFVYAPFLLAQTKVFAAWSELSQNLATNAQEWGRTLKEGNTNGASAIDERVRKIVVSLRFKPGENGVEAEQRLAVCNAAPVENNAVENVTVTADASGQMAIAVVDVAPGASPQELALMQLSLPQPAPRLVREVRRWRENAGMDTGIAHDALGRELVLLYVLPGLPGDAASIESIDTASPGRPFSPRDVSAATPVAASPDFGTSLVCANERPGTMTAEDVIRKQAFAGSQVAADSVSAGLDVGTFDMLLTSLLELRATVPEYPMGNLCKPNAAAAGRRRSIPFSETVGKAGGVIRSFTGARGPRSPSK